MRVQHVDVDLYLADAAEDYAQFERTLQQFENFCVVTESVRSGIAVAVQVYDGSGQVRHASINKVGG